MGRIGPLELVLVLVAALVIFGPSKLPEIGKALGKSVKEFKNHISSITESEKDSDKTE